MTSSGRRTSSTATTSDPSACRPTGKKLGTRTWRLHLTVLLTNITMSSKETKPEVSSASLDCQGKVHRQSEPTPVVDLTRALLPGEIRGSWFELRLTLVLQRGESITRIIFTCIFTDIQVPTKLVINFLFIRFITATHGKSRARGSPT